MVGRLGAVKRWHFIPPSPRLLLCPESLYCMPACSSHMVRHSHRGCEIHCVGMAMSVHRNTHALPTWYSTDIQAVTSTVLVW